MLNIGYDSNQYIHQDMDKKEKEQSKKDVIHKGLFIADERRKGYGGRIKSQSIPNKIDVQLGRNQGVLHESEVQWIQIRRYNRKQKRNDRPKKQDKNSKDGQKPKFQQKTDAPKETQNKNNKYKLKDEPSKVKQEGGTENKKEQKKLKFMPKEEAIHMEKKNNQQQKVEKVAETQTEQNHEQKEQKKEKKYNAAQEKEERENDKRNDNKQSDCESEQSAEKTQKGQNKQKQQQSDIVIVAKVLKELDNPFWNKQFVGVMQFVGNKEKKKGKFRERGNDSHITVILDDHFLDVTPIHMRLPKMEVNRSQEAEEVLKKYVAKTIKFKEGEKGGAIRNKILDELEEVYVLVQFDKWRGQWAFCNLIKVIGKVRTIDGECNCFLHQHELNDFEHDIEIPQEKICLNPTQIYKPFEQMVFTIDPITSTDLDDALSVKKINQDEYEIGIHIADVSAFIHHIDRSQIVKRTTSVYLPHTVYHMLPSHLVEICSLNPGVKRQAFSIFVKMNSKGQIFGESRLEKNVLISRFKLAYQQAQSIIVDEMKYQEFNQLHQCSEQEFKVLSQKLHILANLGMQHRKQRLLFDVFENKQLKFKLNEQKWPIDYSIESRFTAQKVIQEFMIIGNIEAAKKIVTVDPQNSLVIHHPTPSALGRKQFNENFESLKMQFHFDDIKQLQKDLMKVNQMTDISENIKQICFFKARRVQQAANYKRYSEIMKEENSQKIHFALGLQFYTHFTSPMRRIGDIMVHEVLNSIMDPNHPKKIIETKEIEQANWGRKNTKRLKKDLNQIYLCLMIYHTKKPIKTEGIVASFGSMSVSIYIPLLDTMKQVMWRDMDVYKVSRNRKDNKKFDVIIYFDKKDARKDVIWEIEKFEKIGIVINYTKSLPLRMELEFTVKTNKGKKIIQPL